MPLRNWYNCSTKHFHLIMVVRWKWKNQLDWVIKPVPHDLVRRIRFWKIKSPEQDFKCLYWIISKMLFWNVFTCKGTYMIDWVGRVWVTAYLYAFPPPSISIHTYSHVRIYIYFDYSVMTPYDLFTPLTKRLCVPAPSGVTRCLHTCDPMSQRVCFSHHACLRFLWLHIHHVHMKRWNSVCTCPLPYVRSPTTSSFVSFPST